jgi:alkylation response protein AidB-like acyl-CoA dehydrogenase
LLPELLREVCGKFQAILGHVVRAVLDHDIVGPDPGNDGSVVNPSDAHPGIPQVTGVPAGVRLAGPPMKAGREIMRARCLDRHYVSQLWQLVARAESVLTPHRPPCHLPAETARWSTITQIYEGTNQIQRMVMARQLLKG